MSIANELSCDVAAAMLAYKNGAMNAIDNKELTNIVLEFHSTLRRLTGAERQRRRSNFLATQTPKPLSKRNVSSSGL